jgi:hypothetical protein
MTFMGYLDITPSLIGSLAECYYKEYCDQKGGWAYTSLESIHKNGFKDDKLEFKIGFQRYLIKIPKEIISEIKRISEARYLHPNNPSYVFDFLACKIYEEDENLTEILNRRIDDFSWVEVKSEGGRISKNQLETAYKVSMPFALCVVSNVRSSPSKVLLNFYYNEIPEHMFE